MYCELVQWCALLTYIYYECVYSFILTFRHFLEKHRDQMFYALLKAVAFLPVKTLGYNLASLYISVHMSGILVVLSMQHKNKTSFLSLLVL